MLLILLLLLCSYKCIKEVCEPKEKKAELTEGIDGINLGWVLFIECGSLNLNQLMSSDGGKHVGERLYTDKRLYTQSIK